MIALLLVSALSQPQLPTEAERPAELDGAAVQVLVQVTETHFVATNEADGPQLLVFGSLDRGRALTVGLRPGQRVVYPFPRGTADDLLLEVVSVGEFGWRNTGAVPVAALRDHEFGALWIQVASGHSIGWVRGPLGLEHLVPSGGLISGSILAMDPEGLVDYATVPARHVPVITPVDKKRVEKPPVLDEDVLPPV